MGIFNFASIKSNQTINENGEFEKIHLDQVVHDPDHADELLSWSYSGNMNLVVEKIAQQIIQITVSDSEWTGTERITFIVTDPDGMEGWVSTAA